MRRFSLLLLVLALLALPLTVRSADEFKLEPGFKLLLNGKNLDGWKEAGKTSGPLDGKTEAFGGRFKVTDGKLVIDPAVKGDLYIETTKEFPKDVHIKFDFMAGAKCNNDLFLRGTKFDLVVEGKETKNIKEGVWSTCEVIVKGESLEHKVNGEVIRTTKLGEKNKTSGFKLRAEFGSIEIKNLRAKE